MRLPLLLVLAALALAGGADAYSLPTTKAALSRAKNSADVRTLTGLHDRAREVFEAARSKLAGAVGEDEGGDEAPEDHAGDAPETRFVLDAADQEDNAVLDHGYTGRLREWVEAGTVARFLGLRQPAPAVVPVTVNVLLVGLDGSGRRQLALDPEDVSRWLERAGERRPHAVVRDVRDRDDHAIHSTPPASDVEYRYAVRAALLPEAVLEAVETLIRTHARDGVVAPRHLEALLSDLLRHLGLDDGYTLFVLNPRLEAADHRGYRPGFSAAELSAIAQSDEFREIDAVPRTPRAETSRVVPADQLPELPDNDREIDASLGRVAWVEVADKAAQWADASLRKLSLLKPRSAQEDALTLLNSQDFAARYDLLAALQRIKLLGAGLGDVTSEEGASCVTDNWVSAERFAWLDLSAAPAAWGPTVGGVGVRTEASFPRVPSPEAVAATTPAESSDTPADEARARLRAKLDRLGPLLEQRGCSEDGGGIQCETLRERHTVLKQYFESFAEMTSTLVRGGERERDAAAALLREHDALGLDLLHALSPLTVSDAVSSQTSGAVDRFLAKTAAAAVSLMRQVVTPPSGHPQPLPPLVAGHEHGGEHAGHHDHVAASRLSPALPAEGVRHPRAVAFHVYLLCSHSAYDPLAPGEGALDYAHLTQQLSLLRLPDQEFSFVLHRLSPDDDAALAVAFESSLRSAVLPVLSADGVLSTRTTRYVDSLALQQQLETLRPVLSGVGPHTQNTRTVPIFVFSVPDDEPLLLDRYYFARAVSDMVLVAQSRPLTFESHLSCSGQPVVANPRNPEAPLLGAAALVLGGLVPAHIRAGPQGDVDKDWRWSVGASPRVACNTLAAPRFSDLDVDAAHRNELAQALAASRQMVTAAVGALAETRTTPANGRAADAVAAADVDLRRAYIDVQDAWGGLQVHAARGEFEQAAHHINPMLDSAAAFLSRTREVLAEVQAAGCSSPSSSAPAAASPSTRPRKTQRRLMFLVGALLAGLWLVLRRPGKGKPKIN